MDELLNILRTRYNYDDQMLKFLGELIPTMIEYFGEEYKDNIVSTFIETPIIITKKGIAKEIGDDTSNFLFVGGVYWYDINTLNNKPEKCGKVIINDTIINPFSFNDVNKVGVLVHELCHMVKSGLIINNDGTLTHYVGLSQDYGKLINNEFEEQSVNNADGLEEALNAIDETMIMAKMYSNYELKSNYKRLASYINELINSNPDFLAKVRESQFMGNNTWKEYLGSEISENLIELCREHNDIFSNRMFELLSNKNLAKRLDDIEDKLVSIINMAKEISKRNVL